MGQNTFREVHRARVALGYRAGRACRNRHRSPSCGLIGEGTCLERRERCGEESGGSHPFAHLGSVMACGHQRYSMLIVIAVPNRKWRSFDAGLASSRWLGVEGVAVSLPAQISTASDDVGDAVRYGVMLSAMRGDASRKWLIRRTTLRTDS